MPQRHSKPDLNIYQDAARYDAENWWKTDDLAFWGEMAREFGPNVLELAAGTARLAPTILDSGASYTGLDAATELLQRAGSKVAEYGERARLLEGDMRQFDLGNTFDLIIIAFNSFLHLLTDEDALAALACIRRHCHAHTRFALDIFVPDPLFLYRPEGQKVPAKIYTDPATGAKVNVMETNRYEPGTDLNQLRWYYSTADNPDFLVLDFTLRMIFPDTMDRLLHDAGFRVLEKWGDYRRTPLNSGSALQIYMAERAG
ncbi:MAG: class I SAM-dependent methyltransferase [Candidatus Marinimicrobia bacterium]|nr:class I SAM-dependent methyltransferase [Candidatus Neomarinimicrobiota bacterium]